MSETYEHLWRYATGGAVGAFTAGIVALAWGDQRYLRRAEFEQHQKDQESAGYVTQAQFHSIIDNAPTQIQLSAIQAQLASTQTDIVWIKSMLQSNMLGQQQQQNNGRKR